MRVAIRSSMLTGLMGMLVLGCGPKEVREPTPEGGGVDEPAVRQTSGPPEKLMSPDTRPLVDAVFTSQKGEIERCYNDYVSKTGKTKLRGRVTIAVRIGYKRTPLKVWFLKNTFKDPTLNECFLEKVRAWIFPTWGGWMDYSFPTLILEEL
jgi:hypothetical protein